MYERKSDYRASSIKKLSDLKGYTISEGDPDIRGWVLVDKENNNIGKVDDLLIDTDEDKVVYSLVSYGSTWGMGDSALIPLSLLKLDRKNGRVIFDGNADDVKSAPRYRKDTTTYDLFDRYWNAVSPVAGAGAGRESRAVEGVPEKIEERAEGRKGVTKGEHAARGGKTVVIPFEVVVRQRTEELEEEEEEDEARPRRTVSY